MKKIGIIGGSGLYDLEGLRAMSRRIVTTPFGRPSGAYVRGTMGGREVVFLPRHGRGHRLMPSEINHRANIYGFKAMGVERILSISAVGSLREEMRPRDIVLPDQYFDRTKGGREHTFFGDGVVAHISFGQPTCPELRKLVAEVVRERLAEQAETGRARLHVGGTYVSMEGPAFSTRAESETYRKMGLDVIGMTSLPEAKLCREAEICYQAVCMVTDYDCWHTSEAAVTVEMIVEHLKANVSLAKKILGGVIARLPEGRACSCGETLRNALITDRREIPARTLKRLYPIIGRYV